MIPFEDEGRRRHDRLRLEVFTRYEDVHSQEQDSPECVEY